MRDPKTIYSTTGLHALHRDVLRITWRSDCRLATVQLGRCVTICFFRQKFWRTMALVLVFAVDNSAHRTQGNFSMLFGKLESFSMTADCGVVAAWRSTEHFMTSILQ